MYAARRQYAASFLAACTFALAACADQVPTGVGDDLFPGDTRPITGQVDLPASDFFEELGRFGGFADAPGDFLIVANAYQGRLNARPLVRFTDFPESVAYDNEEGETVTDTVFAYVGGTVSAGVDVEASASAGAIDLELWTLEETWDPASASWEMAVDTAGEQTAWSQPGATLGRRLATTTWEAEGDAFSDTLTWAVDSLAVREMADEESFPGLAIVAAGATGRLQLGPFALEAEIRPETREDTVLVRDTEVEDALIFDPPGEAVPPEEQAAGDPFSVGGTSGNRIHFRMELPDSVPVCSPGQSTDCPLRSIDEVTVNRAALLFTPARVGDGFDLLGETAIRMHTLGEPELGRRAPLGALALDGQGPDQQRATVEATDTLISAGFTNRVRGLVGEGERGADFVLVGDAQTPSFAPARFSADPRLRLTVSVPGTVDLP